jgi:hypothetical protein
LTLTTELFSIILSVVALAITVVGFFASLYFYRHSIDLQADATRLLAKIEERTDSINTQVGGIFEKTLDAALASKAEVRSDFSDVAKELEAAKSSIMATALQEIGDASRAEQDRLRQILDAQLGPVQERLDATRKTVEAVAFEREVASLSISDFEERVLAVLHKRGRWATAQEISGRAKIPLDLVRAILERFEQYSMVVVQLTLFEGIVPEAVEWRTYGLTQLGRWTARARGV